MGAFWHPFANMAQVDGHELVMVHGDGVFVTDRDGKRYLDGTAGLWYNTVGYDWNSAWNVAYANGHFAMYDVNTVAHFDPDIIPLLDAPRGSAFARDPSGAFVSVPFPGSYELN